MKRRAYEIHHLTTSKATKIRLLNDLIADCLEEMEAQEQNMHPEIEHNLAEGYRVAKNYLRRLGSRSH